jgi:biotin carboxyl carrier protein
MKYSLESSSGRKFEIEVQPGLGDHYSLTMHDQQVEADFFDVDRLGQYAVRVGDHSYAVSIEESDQQHLSVTIAGISFAIKVLDEQEKTAASLSTARPKTEVMKASMPGIVIEVRVKPGDAVEAGQGILILEAMKMQNELATIQAGVVEEVFVKAGDTVAANQALAKINPFPESETGSED